MTSATQQRRLARRQRAEELLRAGEYTAGALAKALQYGVPNTRAMLSELLGKDRAERHVYVSSWDISRSAVRIIRLPRYRWRSGHEMDVKQPTLAECREMLESSIPAPLPPPPATLAKDPLLCFLFGHLVQSQGTAST